MRPSRTAIIAIALTASMFGPWPAAANVPTEFTACVAPDQVSDHCTKKGDDYLAGSSLYFRGEVTPAHSEFTAKVLRRKPGGSVWRKVATVDISATGRMGWTWDTRLRDGAIGPYKVMFRIPGHGKSAVVSVGVIVGE